MAAYINKQGGTRSTHLNALAAELWTWCRRRDIIPIASYSPGQDKLIADFLSRGRVPPSEWTLHSQVMATIFRTFGLLHMDLYALALYAQLQRHCAQALDPAAWRIEPSQFGGRDSRGTPFPRPHPPNSTEGEAGSGYRPPHCPVVAEENMVPRNDNPSSGVSENPPRSQGRDIPADTGDPAPKAVRPPPDCLALVREAGAQAGFSVRLRPLLPAAGEILPERRTFPSCRIFQLVRISGGGSPFGTSDGRGRFLSSLFDKGRLVSKIRGYRSAIAAIHNGFPDGSCVPTAPSLTGWVRVFFLERTPARKFLPTWSLPCVLEALAKAPFEPLAEASLRDVTIKKVFLMAIASGHRRCALHALPAAPGHIR